MTRPLFLLALFTASVVAGPVSTRRARHLNPRAAGATMVLDARFLAGLSDGAAVATWADRSGSANDATQGTSGKRPLYKIAIQGGQPALRFDGTDDSLAYSSALFTYTGAATVVAVVKASGGASNFGSVISEHSGVATSLGCQMTVFPNAGPELATDVYQPGGMRYNSTQSSSLFYVTTWSWTNWSTHKTNGGTSLGVNGSHVAGTAYGAAPSSLTSTTKRIGSFGEAGFYPGDIGSIAVAPAAWSPALRRRIEHGAARSFKIGCN